MEGNLMKIHATKESIVDDFHGVLVEDPYRWLENDLLTETKQWTDKQNKKTATFLQSHPDYNAIKERIEKLSTYEKYTIPQKVGNYYYFHKNSGKDNQPIFYRSKTVNNPTPEIVIDPNKICSEGLAAIQNVFFSHDAKKLAYSLSYRGSDVQEIHIKDLHTGEKYSDVIHITGFSSIAWDIDNNSFYYSSFNAPDSPQKRANPYYNKVYLHTLGTEQLVDEIVYDDTNNKELSYEPLISNDKKYLLLRVYNGTEPKNDYLYRPINNKDATFQKLFGNRKSKNVFIGNENNIYYFLTNDNASNGKIISIDLNKPEQENWKEIIPEQEWPISFVRKFDNYFFVSRLNNVSGEVLVYDLDGKFVNNIPLPNDLTIEDVGASMNSDEIFISYTSFVQPTQVVSYNYKTEQLNNVINVKPTVNQDNIEVKQIFYPSKDGTKIPMYIVHKKGLELNGHHPLLLFAYGGYTLSQTPKFSPEQMMWIENGGIYALANIRGGEEYGRDWHQAAIFDNKQNVFDDFISAAEWLIENKYTKPKRLAIMGRSNGGLLVATCMQQRPDLFGAVLSIVPVTDMLRFQHFTFGRFWTTEFGNAETSKSDFENMYGYSPLHTVKESPKYPPILVTTADHDDRVVPAHARKYTATLQEKQPNNDHIFYLEEKNAGHGHGKPLYKVIENFTDIYTFMFKVFDLRLKN